MLTSERIQNPPAVLELCGQELSVPQVAAVSSGRQPIQLRDDEVLRDRLQASVDLVCQAVDEAQQIYGVTTGFGSMVDVRVRKEQAAASQTNLLWFLAAGAGPPLDVRHVRGAMLLRANMLLRGVSGVRFEIVERLMRFLAADAIPVVRELGSIGASGDLVPLASIARAIIGHEHGSRVVCGGQELEGETVLAELGYEPLELLPKEALAIVNGTSFSAAVAANSLAESRHLLALSLGLHAVMIRALCGHEDPFLPFVHECKPHPGQIFTARTLLHLLRRDCDDGHEMNKDQFQDRYSIRCLPQYFGPIVEGIVRLRRVVETEMNAVTDNPLVDAQGGCFYQSGNFLGQYIAVAMDELRGHLSLLAKHLDVQIAQLVSPEFSHGLPASLQGNPARSYNMGLKGLQITGNSIVPMLTHHASPLVQHYPTHAEQYNQNINGLSWGAANLAWRCVDLFQHYSAVASIFAVQAIDLRSRETLGHYDGRAMIGPLACQLYEAICRVLDVTPGGSRPLVFNDSDQSLESHVERLADSLRNGGPVIQAVAPIVESLDAADF